MTEVYSDYTRDRVGMYFGLTGGQLATLVVAAVPILWAFNDRLWGLVGIGVLVWAVVFAVVALPIRGRSATGWLIAAYSFAVGTLLRVTRWRSKAAKGQVDD